MKVAWLGDKAKERGEGLITYSKEIIKDLVSAPGAKEIIDEVLGQERVDVAHASLSFSLLIPVSQISDTVEASLSWPSRIFLMTAPPSGVEMSHGDIGRLGVI